MTTTSVGVDEEDGDVAEEGQHAQQRARSADGRPDDRAAPPWCRARSAQPMALAQLSSGTRLPCRSAPW